MHASIRFASILSLVLGLGQSLFLGPLQAAEQETVGTFTAIEGQVHMTRQGGAQPVSVKLSDAVVYKAVIETQGASRAKALFLDDSMLTMSEHSKIQINEQIYAPNQGKRSMVFSLLEGKVRALVTKVFQGPGSRFEIRTPSAVAAARGTDFVVWIEPRGDGQGRSTEVPQSASPVSEAAGSLPIHELTGIANIGDSGNVDFTSHGQTVTVKPGQYATAVPGQPPVPPIPIAKGVPSAVSQAIQSTKVADAPKPETPRERFRATANATLGLQATTPGPGMGGKPLLDGLARPGNGRGASSMAPGMSTGMSSPTPAAIVNPPAAFSGALSSSNAPGQVPAFVNPPTPGGPPGGPPGGGPPGGGPPGGGPPGGGPPGGPPHP